MERNRTKKKKLLQYLTVNNVKDIIDGYKQRVDEVREKFAVSVHHIRQ